jgi:hypothetical protein
MIDLGAGWWIEVYPFVVAVVALYMAFWGLVLGVIPATREFPVSLSWNPFPLWIERRRRDEPPDPEFGGWIARVIGGAYLVVAGCAMFRPGLASIGLGVLLVLGWWLVPRIGYVPRSRRNDEGRIGRR